LEIKYRIRMEKYRFGNKKIRLGWKNTDLEIKKYD
jgi:hypothetical protein